jgi:hypothetical protein
MSSPHYRCEKRKAKTEPFSEYMKNCSMLLKSPEMHTSASEKGKTGKATAAFHKRYISVFRIAVSFVASVFSACNLLLISPSILLVRKKPQSNLVDVRASAKRHFYRRVTYLHWNQNVSITLKKMKATSLHTIKHTESNIESLCNEFYSNATTESSSTTKYTDSCFPMAPWQTLTFPTCNTIYEFDLLSGIILNVRKESDDEWKFSPKAQLVGKGGSRLVFRIFTENEYGDVNYQLALKVPRFDREFEPISYENQRVDALASERLTSAPDIMDIYSFCGLSALNEVSSGLDVRQLVKNVNLWHPLEIVEMILQASTSLARVHSIDYRGSVNATLVHNDLTHNNYMVSNKGRLKLSDFNLSVLLRWNSTSNKSCGFLQRRFGGAGGIHVVSVNILAILKTCLLQSKFHILFNTCFLSYFSIFFPLS